MTSLMGMGLGQLERQFDLKRMSQEQAADYLLAALRSAARKVVGLMEIVPAGRTTRFEQLEAGESSIHMDGWQRFYALKTQQPTTGDRSTMVLLGPSFIQDVAGILSRSLAAGNGLVFRQKLFDFAVARFLLRGRPRRAGAAHLFASPLRMRTSNVCTDGGHSPQHYFGMLRRREDGCDCRGMFSPARPPLPIAGRSQVSAAHHPPRSILKHPFS